MSATASTLVNSPAAVRALPPAVRAGVQEAFVKSLHTEFLTTVPFAILAFLLTLALKELKLRTTTGLHASKAADAKDAQDLVDSNADAKDAQDLVDSNGVGDPGGDPTAVTSTVGVAVEP